MISLTERKLDIQSLYRQETFRPEFNQMFFYHLLSAFISYVACQANCCAFEMPSQLHRMPFSPKNRNAVKRWKSLFEADKLQQRFRILNLNTPKSQSDTKWCNRSENHSVWEPYRHFFLNCPLCRREQHFCTTLRHFSKLANDSHHRRPLEGNCLLSLRQYKKVIVLGVTLSDDLLMNDQKRACQRLHILQCHKPAATL